MCNSGWRFSPGYGYAKGFDLTIYKKKNLMLNLYLEKQLNT